jgi:hypothetical protein
MDIKKKKVAVIGTGSGGIQTLAHFLTWLDGLIFEVVSIQDPNIPILGIGESTNPTFIEALQYGINFDITEDLDTLDGTYKFGTRFEKWRYHDFTNPLITGNIAIHFDTYRLKDFALPRLRSIWKEKFSEVVGTVDGYEEKEDYVSVMIDGCEHQFDYLIDCRGFPKSYDDYMILPYQTVNHALVHNVKEQDNQLSWKYTMHRATKDGWMFGVPLQSRKSYGYMFNKDITPIDQAKKNFSEEIGVPVDQLQNIEYSFCAYRAKQIASNRVFMNGCRAVFFEPLFANSLWLYKEINIGIFKIITENVDSKYVDKMIKENIISSVAEMIAYMYHGGSTYETDFWNEVVKPTTKVVENSDSFYRVKNKMRFMNNRNFYEPFSFVFDEKNLKTIDSDTHFQYNYFQPIILKDAILEDQLRAARNKRKL